MLADNPNISDFDDPERETEKGMAAEGPRLPSHIPPSLAIL